LEVNAMARGGLHPLLDLETRSQQLLGRGTFLRRWAVYAMISAGLIVGSLALGMVGYRIFEGMSWLDAYLNAAMLLGGMGPVAELRHPAGKVFAGLYAMFSGLVLLVSVGVMLAPVFHRFLHRFHLDLDHDT
jgi:hypothetical protein